MADQDRDEQKRNDRKQGDDQNAAQDDVAEDRNLSGASTWLNLPDKQPKGDADQSDTSDRQSNR